MVHRLVTSATLWFSKSSIIWEVRGWVLSTLAHDGEEDRATMREPRPLEMDDLLSYVPKEKCGSGRDHGHERRSYSSCSKSSPWESLYFHGGVSRVCISISNAWPGELRYCAF